MLITITEEDRKALTAMLGKLYITADSSLERLTKVNELVIEAIDGKVASEAASRTALNKLHFAVGKALGDSSKRRSLVAEEAVIPDDALEEGRHETAKIEEIVEETGVVEEAMMTERVDKAEEIEQDSMVDELLDDESDL